jgi:ATP-dependent RNA helicase DHX8/PRP22
MSESLKKLKEIPVVNKIMQELDRSLGVKDKILAEFILDIAKKCSSVAQFEKELINNEAEFSIDLVNTIYATATRMLLNTSKQLLLGKRRLIR